MVVDKPAGLTSHDVVARLRRILRHPQGRPRRHARPDGHRRAGAAASGAARSCSATSPWTPRPTPRRSGSARPPRPTTPRARSSPRRRPVGRVTDAAVGRRDGRADRRHPAGAQRGQRDQGRRAAGLRAGAGGGAGRAARPAGHGLGVHAAGPARRRTSTSRSSARRAPTSAPWPATSAPRSASAGTSPRCAAPASVRSACEQARTLDELAAAPALSLTLDAAVAVAFARRDVDAAAAADLAHGRPLPAAGIGGTYGVFAPDGRVLGAGHRARRRARPVVVLAPGRLSSGAG